jgi:hypothetical protein
MIAKRLPDFLCLIEPTRARPHTRRGHAHIHARAHAGRGARGVVAAQCHIDDTEKFDYDVTDNVFYSVLSFCKKCRDIFEKDHTVL